MIFLIRKQVLLPIIEFLIGVFIGAVIFALGEFIHDTSKKCFTNLMPPSKTLHIQQEIQTELNNKFMFIGMRSTHSLIKRRGIAALETWAQDIVKDVKNIVQLQIFAESNLDIENVEVVALENVLRGLLVVAKLK